MSEEQSQPIRDLKASAVAAALGVTARTVQGYCAGHAGKTHWPRPCPHSTTAGGQLRLNLEEVKTWGRAMGVDKGWKTGATSYERRVTSEGGSQPHRSSLVARDSASPSEPDLFELAGGPRVLTAAEAARRFMQMFEELSGVHRDILAASKGLKGVKLNDDTAAIFKGVIEARGVNGSVMEKLFQSVDECGLYLGPAVALDFSASATNQLTQAMAKLETAGRMQQIAHQEEQERRGEKIDREMVKRLASGAATGVRTQLSAAGEKAVRGAMDAAAAGGLVFARKGEGEGGSVLVAVSEQEVERLMLPALARVMDTLAVQCAAVLVRMAEALERRAAAEGRAA